MALKRIAALGGYTAGIIAGLAQSQNGYHPDLNGEIALITGGSRGFGLALARELAREGCRIAICARNQDELLRAAAMLEKSGDQVLAIPCDVTNSEQVERMIERVTAHYGRIDILVPNAGEMKVAPIENTTIADFRSAMDVMFWGALYPTMAVLPQMRSRGSGRIVPITSIGGKVSVPHLNAYSCAKFAAVAFFEGLRAELAPIGIQVTTILPGLMRTGSHIQAKFKGNYKSEAAWFSVAATAPVISMKAEIAARKTVDAIKGGAAEKILATDADLLARVHGAFPGLIPNLLGLVNLFLPPPTHDRQTEVPGKQLQDRDSNVFRYVTALGRSAAAQLNQT